MRFSKIFAPTSKEEPSDAVVISHSLLVKAGFIQQVSSGIYNFLPLGLRVLAKIENIIRKELNKAGAQESKLGFVTPLELWEQSGRASKYGKELLKFTDRKNNSFVLGPTHEEMMVNLVKSGVRSYKQLPLNIYQIHTKFRDEARPRFGILRGREFIMKDGYSFHENTEDMQREFSLMETTYKSIFSKMGLDYRVVDADSGSIGGSGSREFMVLADSGEDDIVLCSSCEYSANIETAQNKYKEYTEETSGPFAYFSTPKIKTIDEVSEFFHIQKDYILKAVVKKAIYDDTEKIVVFFVRGSRELGEVKALNACGANELQDASREEMQKENLCIGSIGPVVLEDSYYFDKESFDNKTEGTLYKILKPLSIDCYFDKEVQNSKQAFISGANKEDYHFVGLDLNTLKDISYADLSNTQEGDDCIECSSKIDIKKGIEVGHIFQLGDKYSKPLNAVFLDKNQKTQNFIMGTYGIGVSRLLGASIEQHNDDKGCLWPLSISPFEIIIIVSNIKNEIVLSKAMEIYEILKEDDIDVIIDDRADRFGSKMKDFELIGFPYGVIFGRDVEEKNMVQLVNRQTSNKEEIEIPSIVSTIKKLLEKN